VSGVEIVGPFRESRLVIDEWTVPMIQAHEQDGGEILLVLDGRIGLGVPTALFDSVATFVADVIGACWGYGAHPRGAIEDPATHFAAIPHRALAPRHMVEISGASTEGGPE
jgi:hypothetical protein